MLTSFEKIEWCLFKKKEVYEQKRTLNERFNDKIEAIQRKTRQMVAMKVVRDKILDERNQFKLKLTTPQIRLDLNLEKSYTRFNNDDTQDHISDEEYKVDETIEVGRERIETA